jgi:hypothetical protein
MKNNVKVAILPPTETEGAKLVLTKTDAAQSTELTINLSAADYGTLVALDGTGRNADFVLTEAFAIFGQGFEDEFAYFASLGGETGDSLDAGFSGVINSYYQRVITAAPEAAAPANAEPAATQTTTDASAAAANHVALKYRQKVSQPEISAVVFDGTGESLQPLLALQTDVQEFDIAVTSTIQAKVPTANGVMTANEGDYIAWDGFSFHPYSSDSFNALYEPVLAA